MPEEETGGALTADEATELADGVYFAGSLNVLRVIAEAPPGDVRLFLGYAGWGPGQLEGEMAEGIPITYVPARNTIFLSHALAWAEVLEAVDIFLGVNAVDYSGYPDCRDDTLKALQVALNLGMEKRFVIDTPLMWIDKAQTWALAHEIIVLQGVPESMFDQLKPMADAIE